MSRVVEYAHTPVGGVTTLIAVGADDPGGSRLSAGDILLRAGGFGLVGAVLGGTTARRKSPYAGLVTFGLALIYYASR